MITCEYFDPVSGKIVPVEQERIADVLADPRAVVWVDLFAATAEEMEWLKSTFHFHPLALEDVANPQQRPKLDQYENYFFFVMRSISFHHPSLRATSHQLDMFVGPNYLVTLHQTPMHILEQSKNRWRNAYQPEGMHGFLFYLVCDSMVDSYFPVLDEIGDEIDALDSAVFARPDQKSLRRIFTLRHNLLKIRKLLGSTRDAFNELMQIGESEQSIIHPRTRIYFTDIYDHVLRLTDFIDTYRDMLAGSLEAYQSSLANRLNENMQRLTVGATVLATSTVITGFYGMNMLGLGINSDWPYGGHLLLAVLIFVTFIELWLFHRKGWI